MIVVIVVMVVIVVIGSNDNNNDRVTYIYNNGSIDPPCESRSGVSTDFAHEFSGVSLLGLYSLRHQIKHRGGRLNLLLLSLTGHVAPVRGKRK